MREIVMELLREGYVPSWCTACYRKVRGPFFVLESAIAAKHGKAKGKQKTKKNALTLISSFSRLFLPPRPPPRAEPERPS